MGVTAELPPTPTKAEDSWAPACGWEFAPGVQRQGGRGVTLWGTSWRLGSPGLPDIHLFLLLQGLREAGIPVPR